MAHEYLPAAPLIAVIEKRGIPQFAVRSELYRAYHRAKVSGRLTVWAADRLAVGLAGIHPILIWPEFCETTTADHVTAS